MDCKKKVVIVVYKETSSQWGKRRGKVTNQSDLVTTEKEDLCTINSLGVERNRRRRRLSGAVINARYDDVLFASTVAAT